MKLDRPGALPRISLAWQLAVVLLAAAASADGEDTHDGGEDDAERGNQAKYDPDTCVVYRSHKALVTNPDCMRAKFPERFSNEWVPEDGLGDGSVCNHHSCNAT